MAGLPRLALAALAALVIAVSLLIAFPETREALAQLLGLRTIRIIPVTPTPTAPLIPTPTPQAGKIQCCETTLADAQARARFKILLPPGEIPSRVHFQELPSFGPGGQQAILIFGDPSAPRFMLFEATDFLYGKLVSGGTVVEETRVKQERALWLTGAPHLLVYLDARAQAQFDTERTVYANTLAWEIGDVTYRLESDLAKEAAVRLAESLQ